ncbi:L,D-transpeptidase family protein [Beijerinckia sp. L45]|uniref:L,D-transpeptidase family protein n=1 Tax=Beijerinckia sp. L45 TaxID=1641855 RepID=UPI00131D8373|nr:L,D-transpeptidase family protein [Beijerinckia sp. L45]
MRARSPISYLAGASAVAMMLALAGLARAEPASPRQDTAALSTPADHPEAIAPKAAPTSDATPFALDRTPTSSIDGKSTSGADLLSTWSPTETPASAPAKTSVDKADDKGLDPEPNVAIKPPAAAPSSDPIDKLPAKPLDAAKAPAADAPLPPLNAAIKSALDKREAAEIRGPNAAERRKEREAIAFFYIAHDFAPVWSADGAAVAAVDPVIARLAHAGDDALTLAVAPAALKATGTPDEIAESELALSEAVVAYARQASGSRIEPTAINPLIGLKPTLVDATEALETVAAAGADAGDRLRAFNPSEPRYVALRDKLNELRAAHAPATASTIPAGPDLKVGMRDPRVPLIRSRFSLDGLTGEPQDLRYDTEVAAAVADFQKANGLPASGTLTKRTIVALSGGHPSRLEGQLVANMEMWRWMPHELGAEHIEVNVPDFAVSVIRDGVAVSHNRVVVGKKDTPTPLFSNAMQVVIVNPVWNVPESIIKKEMLPKLAADPGYLDRLGYKVVEKHGRLTVQQPSGERNALGRVKFIFPNDYAVYLHDTPSKALFATAKRAYSHGCVRVDQPFRFAETVLGSDKWSEGKLKSLLGDKERYVKLPTPLPIHIEYFTASVDTGGHLELRDDVYGYVGRVAQALGQDS